MKNNFLLAVVAMLFTCMQSMHSQISTHEQPVSIQRGITGLTKKDTKGIVDLYVPDIKKTLHEDSLCKEKNPNGLQRTSVPIPMTLDLIKEGICTDLDDGGKLWQMEIHAEKALALDFVFSKFWLPKGGRFFIFNPLTNETIGAITSQFLTGEKNSPHRFSTRIIKGDNVILEYYQPIGESEQPVILVEKAYYTYMPIQDFNRSSGCEVDVNCSEGNGWQKEKNAVARVYAKFNQGGTWCSGALVNNMQNDLTPYFLTANHCLRYDNSQAGGYVEEKDAISDNNLADWVFYWGYELDSCSATTIPDDSKTTIGATIKANNPYTDFALLQLQEDPFFLSIFEDFIPYYLGWDATGSSGTGGVCIHHPQGDVKKISTYSCTPQTIQVDNSPSAYWGVQWIETENGFGIIESGSSGSPLINNYHHVIGQLNGFGGTLNCYNHTGISGYGKLSVSWTGNGNSDNRRRLDYWLNPTNNIQVVNGLFPYTINGSHNLYDTSVYSIPNLPSNYTVTWSLTGDNASNFTLLANTPSANQCTITRKQNVEFSGLPSLVLSAHVSYIWTDICTSSMPINAPYISGDPNPCLTEIYRVVGLGNNDSVTWNLSATGYSIIQNFIPTNTEQNNYLGVQRTSSQDFASGTITANVLVNGNAIIGTLTKNISSSYGFTGTWYQSSSFFPPFTPDATPSNLECGVMYFVDPNKTIVLESDDFIGATMTCNNGNVSLMHFQNSNTASFYTNTNNGKTFTVRGYKSGTCIVYKFIFKAIGEPILDLSVNSSGHDYVFSLLEKQAEERSGENLSKSQYSGKWQLTITQYETGQTVYEGNCDSQSITVNTAGWKPGVYVVIAKANDNTITQKFAITE